MFRSIANCQVTKIVAVRPPEGAGEALDTFVGGGCSALGPKSLCNGLEEDQDSFLNTD